MQSIIDIEYTLRFMILIEMLVLRGCGVGSNTDHVPIISYQ
jgi:hypothetical protein